MQDRRYHFSYLGIVIEQENRLLKEKFGINSNDTRNNKLILEEIILSRITTKN